MPTRVGSAFIGRWAVRWMVALALASVSLATTGAAGVGQPALAAGPASVVDTPYGPLGPADRELLVRVRLAGLWEIPAGQMAAERGSSEELREIGHHIREEHIELDDEVLEVAAELQVPLPDRPHADHQLWLDELERRSGEQFDRLFIQVLREAHGEIYPVIADVRAGTRNELVREFADTAQEFVGRHLAYLESSGLVDWQRLPPPAEPGGTQSRFLAAHPAGVHPGIIWLLLVVAAVSGAVAFVRTLRPR